MSKMKKYRIKGGGTLEVEEGSEFDVIAKILAGIGETKKGDE